MKIDIDNPDFAQIHKDAMAELAASGRSRQDLLDEVQESLRGLRQGLSLYKEINGPERTALHKETLDEHLELWKEYSQDSAGLYEDHDIWELVARVRASNVVQSSVFHRYSTGKLKAHADAPASRPQGQAAQGRGCLVFAALLLPAAAGLASWVI